MRISLFITIGLIASCFSNLFANDSLQSKIIFYREHEYGGSALSYKVTVNDSIVTRLLDASYFEYNCNAGDYTICLDKRNESKLQLHIEANKTYYLLFQQHTNLFTFSVNFIVVDSISAKPTIYNGNLLRLGDMNTEYPRPKNRIGILLAIGNGFSSIPLYTFQNGTTANMNFGGLLGGGILFGTEISKHIDISCSYSYFYTEIAPKVENVESEFSRSVLTITPAYIIPISGGYKSRLKLGIGADYYLDAKMKIIDKKTYDWSYKSTIGWHVNSTLEINLLKHCIGFIGLNVMGVNYSLDKTNSRPISTLTSISVNSLYLTEGFCITF